MTASASGSNARLAPSSWSSASASRPSARNEPAHRGPGAPPSPRPTTDAPIFPCRQGETEWNTEGRLQGHRDSPLTARGRRQAAGNARRLRAHVPFDAGCRVVSSPLGRASHTARLMVTELGLPEAAIDYAAELEECAFGAREGLTRPEIRARFPDDWAARDADRWNVPATGGDSHADVHARVSPWYASLVRDVPMLVVCHGLTSRVLRGIHAGLSPAEVHALDQPQDGFFELAGRSIRFLD